MPTFPRYAVLLLSLSFILSDGINVMSAAAEPLHLSWQWNRPVNHAVLVEIDKIAPESGGLFGILHSPSMADALPDAQIVTAHIVSADAEPVGRTVVMRIPKRELPPLASGQRLAIGYTDDRAAIRVAAEPAGLSTQAAANWFKAWATGQ